MLSGFYVTITFYHPQLYQVWTLRPPERCCVCRLCPSVLFFLIDCLPFSFSLPASFHPSLSLHLSPPPAVAEDDKLPYTILCASAGLDKSCTVEGVWMGVGAGWGPQRNGFNLNYSSRSPSCVYVWAARFVCTRACMCAQKRVSGGKKKKKCKGSSNVNYSGLGHLLCNSKMSRRCMLLHVPSVCVCGCGCVYRLQ